MRARLSVLVPTLNAEAELGACLAALRGEEADLVIEELIVSDGGSADATCEIARAAGADVLSGAPSRGGQLRRAAAAAKGDWLLVLHADTCLGPGWAKPVAAHMAASDRAACFRLRFSAQGLAPRLVAGWANLRTRALGLPYGDQGLLLPMSVYRAAGGYPDQPLMEDVALVRRLGRRPLLLPVIASTSAARYLREGWVRRGARNLWTLLRYLAGADPEALARAYRSENARR